MSVWFQINCKMVNTIWFRVDLMIFRKYFSVCTTATIPGTDVWLKKRAPLMPIEHHGYIVLRGWRGGHHHAERRKLVWWTKISVWHMQFACQIDLKSFLNRWEKITNQKSDTFLLVIAVLENLHIFTRRYLDNDNMGYFYKKG